MVDAFGAVTWWGFSPALDFLEYFDGDSCNTADDLNILVVGGADLRHIVKTMSRRKRHRDKIMNFYIVENNLEAIARQLLLLGILLEPSTKLGYQEKVHIFMELFGNSLIRSQTLDYLQLKSTEFIKLVTEPSYLKETFPLIDLTSLKFKERDQLEAVFKFWRNPEKGVFDITQYWQTRVSHHLGVRYDSRQNVYDWDYNMKLKDKASIINLHEYAAWRENGMAFELREDSAYEFPNRTLASGLILKKDGEKVARRGYWGDIINSPYLSFGIESEETSLFKKTNEVHTKRATEVTEYNITALLHELVTGESYKQKDSSCSKIVEVDTTSEQKETVSENITIDGIRLHFLPLNSVPDLPKKSKYKNMFDLMYFSNSMVHHLTSDLKDVLGINAKLILETTKFMLDLKKEVSDQFTEKICGMARSAGFKEAKESKDGDEDSIILYNFIS